VLALAIGCKGCEDPDVSEVSAAEPEPEPEPDTANAEKLKERLAGLNLDLSKPYPKRADGVIECGEDKICFLARLERCEPALFEHKVNERAGLLVKQVHARYRVEGPKGDSCALQRLVIQADVGLPDDTRKSLTDKGKAQVEIDLMLTEAKALLVSYMAPRVTCVFTRGRALELGLDIFENKPYEAHFQEPCDLVGAEDSWPADLTAPPATQAEQPAEQVKQPPAAK